MGITAVRRRRPQRKRGRHDLVIRGVALRRAQFAALDRLAHVQSRSRSNVLRLAVDAWLAAHPTPDQG